MTADDEEPYSWFLDAAHQITVGSFMRELNNSLIRESTGSRTVNPTLRLDDNVVRQIHVGAAETHLYIGETPVHAYYGSHLLHTR